MSVLAEYAKSAVNTALRVQTGIDKIEAALSDGFTVRARAQAMSDCAELQEHANRMYGLLFKLGTPLPGAMDPLTMRFRELGTNDNATIPGNNSGKSAGMAPGMETSRPSTQARDDGKPKGETGTQRAE